MFDLDLFCRPDQMIRGFPILMYAFIALAHIYIIISHHRPLPENSFNLPGGARVTNKGIEFLGLFNFLHLKGNNR